MAKRKPARKTPQRAAPEPAPQKLYDIREGTVIDHIPAGQALRVLQVLGITDGTDRLISVGMNLSSRKLGKKDIVKVEGKLLTKDELNQLALITPGVSINQISNGLVKEKFSADLPAVVSSMLCPNPNCITRHQVTPGKFHTLQKKPLLLTCAYCERLVEADQIALTECVH